MKCFSRKLAIILTASILFLASLAGCSNKPGTTDNKPATSAPAPEKTATDYPNKPIQLLLIHKAGASTDIIARTLQPYLSKELGVQVVVQNLPGGGGTQAMSQLSKEKADGYTLLMSPFPSATLKQVLTPNVDFDVKEYSYVGGISSGDNNALAVKMDSPIKTFADFVAASKEKSLKVAGSGMGTNGHLASALLMDKAKLKFTYVPFEGGPEAINAVLGNQVDATVADIVGVIPLVNSGQMRLIAVTGSQRDKRYNDVPTIAESGFPEVAFNNKVGIVGPKGLPEDIVKKLSDALQKITSNEEFIQVGAKTGFSVSFTSSEDMKATSLQLLELVQSEKEALSSMK